MSSVWVTKYLPERLKDLEKVRAGRLGAWTKSATRRVAQKLSETRGSAPPPGFHVKKDADDTDRFLDGLENLYFLRPGDELTKALENWCRTKKVHWSIVVTEALKLFFSTQGVKL